MINLIFIRIIKSLLTAGFVFFLFQDSFSQSQTNCPAIPALNYLDTNCFMPVDGELRLGQGTVDFTRDESSCGVSPANTIDFYYPCNRPTWPIAIAHTWLLSRNILKQDWYNINSFAAILLKETTGGSCDDNLDYSCYPGLTYPISGNATYQNDACNPSSCGCIACSDGCYQISQGDGGWATLQAYYPVRYPDNATMAPWIEGGAGFETATLSRMYYDLAFIRGVQFAQGLDPMPIVDGTNDPYGAIYLSARAYNEGFGAGRSYAQSVFNGATNRTNALNSTDWSTIIGPFGYADKVVHFNQVLDNNYTPCNASDPRGWHNWYDADVAWATVDTYMEKIFLMYTNELTVPQRNAIKSRVQAVFDQADVDMSGGVSFRYEMGPVIDALALNIPYDDPTSLIINSNDGDKGCKSGWCTGPLVTITPMGPTTVCEGLSVELVTVEGTGFTYQWTKDDVNYANSNSDQHILFATESGSYSVFVTDDQGCTIGSCCPIEVIVEDCSSCNMAVNVSGMSNSCTGIADGAVQVISVTGVSGPFSYNWTGQATGTGQVFSNVSEGTYYVEVVQDSDPTCLGYASVKIEETDILYQSLDLTNVNIDCDEATLTANIIDNPPSSCDVNFKVEHTGGGCYGSWDKWTYSLVLKVDGVPVGPFEPRANGGNDCNHLDVTLTVPDGGVVSAGIYNNGNSSPNAFDFVLDDSEGANIFTEPGSGHSYPQGAETMIVNGTVSCATTPPDYTFTWSPLTGITVNSSSSQHEEVNANPATTTTYTVQATSTSHNCVLEESTVVNNSCGGCSAPSSATITPQGSTSLCAGGSITLDANNVSGYEYSWYRDGSIISGENGESLVATLAGDYVVRIADPADPMNASCYLESSPVTVTLISSTTPTIAIEVDENPICTGQTVNFSITNQSGEGSSPSYDWLINGSSVGEASTTLTSSTLADGDVISLELTSSEACASPSVVTSSGVTMTVTTSITPSVVIDVDQNPICAGQSANFSITSQSGEGATPSYDWLVNGTSVGETSGTFASSTLADGETVSLELTSSDGCANPLTVESGEIIMSISGVVAPAISIEATETSICPGQEVTFSILSQSGEGVFPHYEWLLNGAMIGDTLTSYTTSSLNDGDVVTLELTSSSSCASPVIVESIGIPISVNSSLDPSVDIVASSPTSICNGDHVTINLGTLVGGDGSETYDWQINSVSSGQTTSIFSSSSLNDQDEITLVVSNLSSCSSSSSVESNTITITVGDPVSPAVDITVDQNPICAGEEVNFTINSQTNEGSSPSYDWLIDGVSFGESGGTLTTSSLTDNQEVSLEMAVVETCVTSQTVESSPITIVVTAPDMPSVEILSTATSICSGDNITFDVDITAFGGGTPTFDWLLNGTSTGSTGITYSNGGLVDGDQVSVEMTSSESCVFPASATSNVIEIDVVSSITPSVTISATTPTSICPNDLVGIEISGIQGAGGSPTYDWFLNGSSTGIISESFTSNTLVDADEVYVVISNLSACADQSTATSNNIDIEVISPVTPAINIVASGIPACANDLITFSVDTQTNQGTGPSFEWFANGISTGETSTSFQSATLNNGDQISLVMTVLETCVTNNPVTSNTIEVNISTPTNPSVEIEAVPTTVCTGETVALSIVNQEHAGSNPTYQWTVNGINEFIGTQLIKSDFNDGDEVQLEMTVDETCVLNSTASSNLVNISVVSASIPQVEIDQAEEEICDGEELNLTTTITGNEVAYSWQINSSSNSETSSAISLTDLQDGDVITVTATSTLTCDNGAFDQDQYVVALVDVMQPELTPANDTVVCEAPGITLELNTTSTSIQWLKDGELINHTGNTLNLDKVEETGTYSAEVVFSDCPSVASNSVNIIIDERPILTLPTELSIDREESITIEASASLGSIIWSPSTFLSDASSISPVFMGSPEAGDFIYTVLVENGACSESGQVLFSVFDALDVPSSFTPNGDGKNEVWNIPGSQRFPDATVRIFNRWGQEVYSQLDGYIEPWKGEMNGKVLPVGTYYYILDLGKEGEDKSINGTVTIVR